MEALMTDVSPMSKPPKQERSRASFEKALEAAADLMRERGDDSFTLQEVSQRSGVSIGSIYGRVEGKAELVRAVQDRILGGLGPRQEAFVDAMRRQGGPLVTFIPRMIEEWAELMRSNATILRAIMTVANRDPQIEQRGSQSHTRFKARLIELILEHRDEIRRENPERAAEACFTICYSTIARYLGFGTSSDASGQGDWSSLKHELGIMAVAYLRFDEAVEPSIKVGRPRRRKPT
jgi:AcrR family transcriptional regulator